MNFEKRHGLLFIDMRAESRARTSTYKESIIYKEQGHEDAVRDTVKILYILRRISSSFLTGIYLL